MPGVPWVPPREPDVPAVRGEEAPGDPAADEAARPAPRMTRTFAFRRGRGKGWSRYPIPGQSVTENEGAASERGRGTGGAIECWISRTRGRPVLHNGSTRGLARPVLKLEAARRGRPARRWGPPFVNGDPRTLVRSTQKRSVVID